MPHQKKKHLIIRQACTMYVLWALSLKLLSSKLFIYADISSSKFLFTIDPIIDDDFWVAVWEI